MTVAPTTTVLAAPPKIGTTTTTRYVTVKVGAMVPLSQVFTIAPNNVKPTYFIDSPCILKGQSITTPRAPSKCTATMFQMVNGRNVEQVVEITTK
jgi:hypothetical protein